MTDLDSLPAIGRPARDALAVADITTLRQLVDHPRRDLLALHGVGPQAVRIIEEALVRHGARLG